MNGKARFAVLAASLLVGLGLASASTSPAAGQEEGTPTIKDAAAALYHGIYGDPVRLVDGRHEGEPFEEGGASRPMIGLIEQLQMEADLDGDGRAERLVFLWENSGGSGANMFLARLSEPGVAHAVFLGNRLQVRGVEVLDDSVAIQFLRAGGDDALCCPGELATQHWGAHGDGLGLVADEVEGRLSLAAIAGLWSWIPTPAMQEKGIAWARATITLQPNGALVGAAPCNRVTGALEFVPPNELRPSPLAATMRLCESPLFMAESYLVSRLQAVNGVGWNMGRLALSWNIADEYGYLLFGAGSPDAPGTSQP
ncbi:MAG: META domain-containing protein [Acidobacteria bacterium]|nr:META domain-containing protein [Acidobacteriota bacterium]